MANVVDAKSIVNAIVGLMATGGSTNHALHIPAMAHAAGLVVNWDDFSDISGVTPLLARVYPNGSADVNQFHAAGGMAFVTRELLTAGLLHGDTVTVAGSGLGAYTQEPWLDGETLRWRPGPEKSLDQDILRPVNAPFEMEGGIRLLKGSLGRGIIKISSVPPDRRRIDAPAAVFETQADFLAAFKAGNYAKAKEWMQMIIDDNDAPAGARTRARKGSGGSQRSGGRTRPQADHSSFSSSATLAMIFAVTGILLQLGLWMFNIPWLTSLANIFYIIALRVIFAQAQNIMHPPPSPIFKSGNYIIIGFFVSLNVLAWLAAYFLTRFLLDLKPKN